MDLYFKIKQENVEGFYLFEQFEMPIYIQYVTF